MTGYSSEEAIGRSLRDLVKSGVQDRAFYQNLWETILAGQVWRGELINRRKDGSRYTEEMTITSLRDAHGEISHFIAIRQDITQRKQLETENEQLLRQFYQTQKMESLGQLAGGIAHDFNNLLVPISGYAELSMLKLVPNHPVQVYLRQIKRAAEQASGLTRQILAFSRQQVMEMKLLDLNQVITEFDLMLRRLVGENITLHTHLAPALHLIKADKGQLEQVLLNLVVNARDAMPDGGTLIIETDEVVLDEVYVVQHQGTQPGPHVLLVVSDTGHGMDAATQQRIFEPFFTTKPQGRGTGLGLAVCFGIIKQHQGNIWVYSEPGRGTTFKVYLPLAEATVATAEMEWSQTPSLHGTETVLLVEDEAGVRRLVGDTLQAYGYQVLESEEPEKGLATALAYEGPIHLLLTDVILPQMNGLELYGKLTLNLPKLKVLYMSGYTNNMITEEAFLQKPFAIDSLLQKVRAVLGQARSPDDSTA